MISTPAATSLSLDEASAFLGVHPNTLQQLAASGAVQGARIGRAWRFLDVDLVAYLRSQYRSVQSPERPPCEGYTSCAPPLSKPF